MDPSEQPYNLEAEKYHQLSRAALFRSTMFDDPTLHAVQALVSCYLDIRKIDELMRVDNFSLLSLIVPDVVLPILG